MEPVLTFIIPVRHQDNAKDWGRVKATLTQTMRSISAQDDKRWRAVIVANNGADLPALPPQFEVCHVDFPPNQMYERGTADRQDWWDAVRFDKGRRILTGLIYAGERGHIMLVDDDDFISCRLTSFVAQYPAANGWFFKQGYVWGDGGDFLYLYHGDFSAYCGTSHIIRRDLYTVPAKFEDASREYICKLLGSHNFISGHLNSQKTPLEPLPFIGAVYRIGHSGHSKTPNLLRAFFLRSRMIFRPWLFVARLLRLRYITEKERKEFFGA